MKNIKLFTIFTVLMLSAFVSTAWSWKGSGTSADPYIIKTCTDLETLRDSVNKDNDANRYDGVYFAQNDDIDCEKSTTWSEPIGKDEDHRFGGHYDGNNYKIINLAIISSSKYVGLFGYVQGAYDGRGGYVSTSLKNIVLEECYIENSAKDSYAAGICGRANYGNTYIDNCRVSGTINGKGGASGITAYTGANLYVTNNFVDVKLSADMKTTYDPIEGVNKKYMPVGKFFVSVPTDYGKEHVKNNYYHDNGDGVGPSSNSYNFTAGSFIPLYTVTGTGFTATSTGATVTLGGNAYFAANASVTLNADEYLIIEGMPTVSGEGASFGSVATDKRSMTVNVGSADVTVSATTSEVHTVSVPEGFTISDAYITIGDVKYYKTAEPYTLELNTENYIIDAISINGVPATIDDGKKTATFKMPSEDVTEIRPTTSEVHTVSVPEGFTISDAYITIGDVKYYKTAKPYTLELNTENHIIEAISINGVPATINDGKKTATFKMPNQNVTIEATTSGIWGAGNGSEEAPYEISTPSELDILSKRVNNGSDYRGKFFKLKNNIEFSYEGKWEGALTNTENLIENFTAIGTEANPFAGHFDGDGKTIRGIRINKPGDVYQGLFGILDGAVVNNVRLADAVILGGSYTGGIAGSNNGDDGKIHDCTVDSVLIKGDGKYYGGVVGENYGEVSDNTSSATLTSTSGEYFGGVVGYNFKGTVSNNTSSATLTSTSGEYFGGVVGYNFDGTINYSGPIENNLAIGVTIPAVRYHGAIVGQNEKGSLSNNYYTACTVGEEKNASNVGVGGNQSSSDLTENNGAVGVDYFSISGDYGEIHQSILPGATIEPIVINYKNVSDITCEGLPKGVECKDDLNGSIIISGNVKGDAVPGDYNYKVRGKTDIGWIALPGAITVRPLPTTSIKVASGNVEQTVTAGGDIEPIKFEYVDANKFLLELFPSGEFSATEDSENKTLTITGTVAAAAKAGKYSARVVAEGKDANDTANVTINVTKPLTSETVTIADIPNQTYTGSEICPEVSVKDGENALELNTDYKVECSNNVNAGTATMTISGNGNYTETVEKTFEIARAPLTVTVSGDTITYGDEIPTEFYYTVKGLINGELLNDVQLNDVTISCGDCAISGYLAVGDYDLSISVEPTSNPNYNVTAVGSKLKVLHKIIIVTGVTAKDRKYNGKKNVDLDGSKMMAEGYIDNDDVSVDLSDATGTMEDANVGKDKIVTVTGIKLRGADAGNYDLKYPKSLIVTIAQATPTVKAPEPIANLVYSGSAQPLVTAGETNFGKLLYSLDDKDYSAEIPAVSHASAYTVYYKVEGSDNWNAVEANSVKVEIKPDTLIVSGAVKILEDQNGGRAEIDGNYSGSEPVKISSQVAVDDVVINRSFTPLKPATVVLPCQLPKGTTVNADFYQLTEVSQKGCSWWASFNYIGEGVVPSANTPYAVVLHDSVSSGVLRFDMNGEMATCQTNTIDTTYVSGKSWYFVGVYSYKEWQEGDEELGLAYAFAGSDNEGGAAKGEFGKIKLKEGFTPHANPLRSYLRKRDKDVQLEASLCRASAVPSGMSLAPAYGVQFVPEPDVIEVEFVKNAFANGNGGGTTIIKGRYNTRTGEFKIYDADAKRTFDVKGRKLNGKPTAKGVYYGKKVAP